MYSVDVAQSVSTFHSHSRVREFGSSVVTALGEKRCSV